MLHGAAIAEQGLKEAYLAEIRANAAAVAAGEEGSKHGDAPPAKPSRGTAQPAGLPQEHAGAMGPPGFASYGVEQATGSGNVGSGGEWYREVSSVDIQTMRLSNAERHSRLQDLVRERQDEEWARDNVTIKAASARGSGGTAREYMAASSIERFEPDHHPTTHIEGHLKRGNARHTPHYHD